ncbi:TonB-dependent receptor [Parvularcula lutaonensis]|uniref:TonB-dependent receptor n=1 Tax=Parvularcula lutaonensis TaxID=491923 RepID=A0ABV7MBG4_9PROT|nr:TonB-dependent receptor [Parvularcula lutaonensis]
MTSAHAQTDDVEDGIEEDDVITVTARRKDETILEAPVAVSAFDRDAIENLQLLNIDDVARFTPGLSFSKAFGRATERPVIRGQSNVLAGVQFGVESGTAYFVDGVYYAGSIQNLDPNELERVEVVKGPQSALYGRNTYAGAINFITRGGTDEPSGSFTLRAGSNDTIDAAASFAGPILPTLNGRLTVRSYEYGGEFRNEVTGELVGQEETFSVGAVLDWEPTENFNSRLRYNYNSDKDGPLPIFLQDASENNCEPGYRSLSSIYYVPGYQGVPFPRPAYTNQNQYYCGVIEPGQVALNTGPDADGIPNVIPGALEGTSFVPIYGLADGTAFDGIDRKQKLISWINELELGGGYNLKFLAGYRDEELKQGYDSDHSPVNWFIFGPQAEPFFANTTRDEVEDYSLELKLSSPTDQRLRWLLGLYYYEQEIKDFDITFSDIEGNDPANFQGDRGIENQAIFAFVEYDITDNLSLTVEGRYAEETKTDSNSPIGEAEFDAFTPRVTLDYDLPNGGVVYALYAEGVKPGGLNGAEGAEVGNPDYRQEESKNYEIGIKTPLIAGLNMTSALFFTDATDVQLTTALATPSGALNSIATNQGSGEIFGFEIEVAGNLNEWFSTAVNYAYVDSEFTKGCDPDEWIITSGGGILNDPANQTGTDFTADFPGSGPASCSIEGRQFPLTSKHQASGFLRYDSPNVGPMGSNFFASLDVTYESSKFVQVHNRAETGDATILGGRIGFDHENWTLSAYGQNINDEDSIVMATRWLQNPYFFANINTAPTGASTSPPRAFFGTLRRGPQYGVELRYRF